MLKVVNLTKIYKTKGGVDTRALDGVTLTFPEKGMVFLLGKSGSGKSTLLNLCGGLDAPTSGEIIVKGRSSKDFSQGDFDSYRNTFVGFIFQEYNILNEFSVEDNIALALELQGKPKDKQAIDALLEEVDLQGYAKRKPNTLSGGQKQRIAIARALIKSPEIIMADEPTGALDSNTGKQVFETLKKLSKEKLVIVVSHDRDFAEQYGDRIIELKDGKVLSDVSKCLEKKQVVGSGNVTVVGGNTLSVEDGKALTEADFQFIRSFLTEREGAMITSGEAEMENFKKANRINEEGLREVFLETDERERAQREAKASGKVSLSSKDGKREFVFDGAESMTQEKEYTKEDGKFIRSRLPLKRAAKIGVSGLKVKPIRLLFTIILCIVSFTMFGLFSTLMLYDGESTLYQSMQDSNSPYVVVKKEYLIKNYSSYDGEIDVWEHAGDTKLSQAEIDSRKGSFGNVGFGGIAVQNKSVQNLASSSDVGALYQNVSLTYLSTLPEDSSLRTNVVAGKYPENEDEVFISEYLAQCIVKNGFSDSQGTVGSVQDVVGKKLKISLGEDTNNPRAEYTIVGVFDSHYQELTAQYNLLAENAAGTDRDEKDKQTKDFQAKYAEGLHGVLFVKDSLMEKVVEVKKAQAAQEENQNVLMGMINYSNRFSLNKNNDNNGYYNSMYYNEASKLPTSLKVYGSGTPSSGEAVVSPGTLSVLMNNRTEEEVQGRQQLVQDIQAGAKEALKSFLQEKGYAYTHDLYITPDNNAEPEQYAIWEKYVAAMYCFDNEINEYGGWLRGENIPKDNTYTAYYLYTEVFLPFVTEGGENSYQAKYNATINLGEMRVTLGDKTDTLSMWLQYLREGSYTEWDAENKENKVFLTAEQKQEIATVLLEAVAEETLQGRVLVWSHTTGNDMQVGVDRSFKVVGIIDANTYESLILIDSTTYEEMVAVTEENGGGSGSYSWWEETEYVENPDAFFDVAFFAYDHSTAQTEALKTFSYEFDETHSRITMQNAVAVQVEMVNSMVTELATVFMWIGIILAVFSALLLSNFISVSITNKKKDIGILRAVGARGVDVFKIFFAESSFIAIICVVISLIISVVTCNVLNTELGSMLSGVSLFVFGPISVAILAAVAIGTAVVATFLPVYLAARKKPVDSIRAL